MCRSSASKEERRGKAFRAGELRAGKGCGEAGSWPDRRAGGPRAWQTGAPGSLRKRDSYTEGWWGPLVSERHLWGWGWGRLGKAGVGWRRSEAWLE